VSPLALGSLPVSEYLRALVSITSFSKNFFRDLKTFLEGSPVLFVSSWRVNSFPSALRVWKTFSSVLFSFIPVHCLAIISLCIGCVAFSSLRYKGKILFLPLLYDTLGSMSSLP
jgi:hypothetical protein